VKKSLFIAFLGMMLIMVATQADATTFTISDITVTVSISNYDFTFASQNPSFNLANVGDSTGPIDVFQITAVERTNNTGDQTGTLQADFSFSQPPGGASGTTDSGAITGHFTASRNQNGVEQISLAWAVGIDPITVTFSDGTQLLVDLNNIPSGTPIGHWTSGSGGTYVWTSTPIMVTGGFTYQYNPNDIGSGDDPNPVPEPTSLLLLGSGVLVLGFVIRRCNN
jgi:hypothetical protein